MPRLMVLVLVGFGFVVSTQSQDSRGTSVDDAVLRQIEAETARLEQTNDISIAKYLADDWVCACPRALSKKEFVANVKSNFDTHQNGINPYTIEKRNMVVHVFGDTAVVTYIKEYRQTTPPSAPLSNRFVTGFRFAKNSPDTTKFFQEDDTDVFTKDGAGWHLRLTKISPVQQAASK